MKIKTAKNIIFVIFVSLFFLFGIISATPVSATHLNGGTRTTTGVVADWPMDDFARCRQTGSNGCAGNPWGPVSSRMITDRIGTDRVNFTINSIDQFDDHLLWLDNSPNGDWTDDIASSGAVWSNPGSAPSDNDVGGGNGQWIDDNGIRRLSPNSGTNPHMIATDTNNKIFNSLTGANKFTIELWIASGGTQTAPIFWMGDSDNGSVFNFKLYQEGTELYFAYSNSFDGLNPVTSKRVTAAPLVVNGIYHVLIMYDGVGGNFQTILSPITGGSNVSNSSPPAGQTLANWTSGRLNLMRNWIGNIYRMAIYNQSFIGAGTLGNFDAGFISNDGDGDGYIDSSFSNSPTFPYDGDCANSSSDAHPSSSELCDGIDNDCDGTTDEGFSLGGACTTGIGDCSVSGTYICSIDGTTTRCSASSGDPVGTPCNDLFACTYNDRCSGGASSSCGGTSYSCDDGRICTLNVCNGFGGCNYPTDTSYNGCNISSACYINGARNPLNRCQECRSATSQTTWTAVPTQTFYRDTDSDSFGNPSAPLTSCLDASGNPPAGYVTNDDDCDDTSNTVRTTGTRNCPYTGPAGTQDVGICRAGTQTCSSGVWGSCTGQVLPGTDNTCNGINEDCDSQTDESYSGPAVTCGTGACQRAGTTQCVAGTPTAVCSPGSSSPESCNNIDDDCDGTVDDSLNRSTTCGTGACSRTVSQTCSTGNWGPVCTPGSSSPESCNNIDDDCDGTIDDSLNRSTTCGVGACLRTVSQSCSTGSWTPACTPGTSSAEVCDAGLVDEDCDGQQNEGCTCVNGTTRPCYSGPAGTQDVGICREGTQTCSSGVWGSCTGQVLPGTDNTCNGINEDCDSQTDESYVGPAVSCGTGACQRAGTTQCVSGTPTEVCTPGASSPESCNNIDDDCDGTVDDSLNRTTTCGTGACLRNVSQTCSAGNWGPVCIEGNPITESCNNVDDDCNGTVDDLGSRSCYSGPFGTQNIGICRAGTQTCNSGNWGVCQGEVTPQATDICEAARLDENCNNQQNEGCNCVNGTSESCYTGPGGTLNIGVCRGGNRTCTDGNWGACVGERTPDAGETCGNAFDDNCNGVPNEGCPVLRAPRVSIASPNNTRFGKAIFLFYGQRGDLVAVASDPDGGAVTYRWEQVAGAPVLLSNLTSNRVNFTAPSQTTIAKLRVTVTDDENTSSSDEISLVVNPDCR